MYVHILRWAVRYYHNIWCHHIKSEQAYYNPHVNIIIIKHSIFKKESKGDVKLFEVVVEESGNRYDLCLKECDPKE